MHQFSASCVYLGIVLILLPTAPAHVIGIFMLLSLAMAIGIWRTHVVFSRALLFISAHGVILGGQSEGPNVINVETGIVSLFSGVILYFLMPKIMKFLQSGKEDIVGEIKEHAIYKERPPIYLRDAAVTFLALAAMFLAGATYWRFEQERRNPIRLQIHYPVIARGGEYAENPDPVYAELRHGPPRPG